MEIEDRVERVAVAGDDHPRGERARALAVEGVEGAVDDVAGIGLARAGPLDRVGDGRGDRSGDRSRKLALKPGRRAEMVEQVGVGSADLGGDGLECHRLGTVGKEQAPSGLDRRRSAFFGVSRFELLTSM